ncbi:TfoX/Sxy family protein [Sphingobium sp. AS12]|uniref:TfoX/Sxy family protein n=1 Tax=Sphingobium sp. AS12 TaxID=2849495 RepID=UPI001C311C09|nr:TfoX/Sxy family protein [Sphingobium sp. AS12]MBV2149864.1 TfoX/Sxy family protein [Sphingobium sp. AS12]
MNIVTSRELALDLAERIGGLHTITVKRFFGGAALVADGVQFGFVMKGSLYLRVDDAGRATFEAMGAAPFRYAAAGWVVTVTGYYEVPTDIVDDPERLRAWAEQARRTAATARGGGQPIAGRITATRKASR